MNGGIGLSGATRRVAEHAREFVRLEIQLAQAELKKKFAQLAAGLGVSVTAAVFAFLALCFGLAAAAAGMATTLPVWLSLLIVCGGLVLLAVILGLVGFLLLREGANAVPEQAIEEAQVTSEALRNGH
ncbi:MAG TPA: phage holin family protein [Gaiellaceae bacterium]|nr:phage holin family protein [Gaiellaceae bacterium]